MLFSVSDCKKMTVNQSFSSVSILICILCFLPSICAFNLTIIHNNDFHTHFAPINVNSIPCGENEECFGGVARTVAKVKQIRNETKNAALFLNAGDHYQGTVWYTFLKWEVVAQFVKLLKHDAMSLGNHEFDDGVAGLWPFLQNVTQSDPSLPILCCNIDASEEPKLRDYIKKSMIVIKDNRKIAIIGYITPDTTFLSKPGKTLKFNDEIESITAEIQELKRQHSDLNIFIALGHSGLDKDKEIARKIADIDVVVGGHSHSFLYTGNSLPSTDKPVDNYPVVFDHGSDGQTLVVQAFAYGKYLGKLDLNFDDNGKIVNYSGGPILLDSSVAEDPETRSQVEERAAVIKANFGNIIGSTRVELFQSNCRREECNLGNLVTDSFVHYFADNTRKSNNSWTSVSIAVVNGGAIRTGVSVGNITMENIIDACPYGNNLGTVELTGRTLWSVLEYSASIVGMGGFLQVSGLRVQYDLRQKAGNRLRKVRVKCADCAMPLYEDLDFNRKYRVIINEYLSQGGDGYAMIEKYEFVNTGIIDYEVFSDYVKEKSPIIYGLDDRIVFSSSHLIHSGFQMFSLNIIVSYFIVRVCF